MGGYQRREHGDSDTGHHREETLDRMMTKYLVLALLVGAAMAAPSQPEEEEFALEEGEGRFLYFNSSSTATSLTLLGALILLGVIFYLVYVGGLLAPAAGSYSNYQRYGQDYGQYYGQTRSFGDVSRRLQGGFELAKYLEVLNMPDEFRELLDEYMDASERSLGQKECAEFFQCPYSLKESVKRNFSGNSL